ncbi:MAG: hypothetical protein ACLFU2_02260 [Opitutales bacterium]
MAWPCPLLRRPALGEDKLDVVTPAHFLVVGHEMEMAICQAAVR